MAIKLRIVAPNKSPFDDLIGKPRLFGESKRVKVLKKRREKEKKRGRKEGKKVKLKY